MPPRPPFYEMPLCPPKVPRNAHGRVKLITYKAPAAEYPVLGKKPSIFNVSCQTISSTLANIESKFQAIICLINDVIKRFEVERF